MSMSADGRSRASEANPSAPGDGARRASAIAIVRRPARAARPALPAATLRRASGLAAALCATLATGSAAAAPTR